MILTLNHRGIMAPIIYALYVCICTYAAWWKVPSASSLVPAPFAHQGCPTPVGSIVGYTKLNWCSLVNGISIALSMFNHGSIFHYNNFAVILYVYVPVYISVFNREYIFIHCPSFIASHVGWSQSVLPRPTECMLMLFLLRSLPCMFSDPAPNGWNLGSHTLWGRNV